MDGRSFDLHTEDYCGDYFTAVEDGAVWFWDHETDVLTSLAITVPEFFPHCGERPSVELNPNHVKSAWINTAFAKSIGKKVPQDGWIKTPAKPW